MNLELCSFDPFYWGFGGWGSKKGVGGRRGGVSTILGVWSSNLVWDLKSELVFGLKTHPKTHPHPQDPPQGALWGWGRGLSPLHKKTCDISILGFSMVRISKMTSVFLLGYPQTLPPGRPLGGGGILVLYCKKHVI